jgi:hypothetical protein
MTDLPTDPCSPEMHAHRPFDVRCAYMIGGTT